jgi:KaiC/GvpD/RAD55 family RecA-like ATPase
MNEEKKETVQERAESLMARLGDLLQNAQTGDRTTFDSAVKSQKIAITKPNPNPTTLKTLTAIKTSTFLDRMFLGFDNNPIHGIPFGSNSILTGLPNSGKSILFEELALRLAGEGRKICYVITEEVFATDTARFDLESRLREKAKIMGVDWAKVSENLFVIDTVAHAEFREWSNFVSAYRTLVEDEKIELVLIDSMTMIEDNRGQLKNRLLDLTRYNQLHGITSLMINQRAVEEADTLAMAGGISLSHIVDVVFVLDYKKISSWDGQLKADIPDAKQGQTVFFFRILKCRLCKYDAHYFGYTISPDGFIKA